MSSMPVVKPIKFGNEELDLNRLLTHDYGDISEASETLPGAMGWLEDKRAIAHAKTLESEIEVKRAEASAYFALKAGDFEAKGYAGKQTEDAVGHAVTLDEDVIKANNAYVHYKRLTMACTGAIKALEAKLELVRSTESTRRRVSEEPRSDM